MTSTPPDHQPVVSYPALLGQVIARIREGRQIKQGDFSAALGLSQSAYSRLEKGESVLNIAQLRNVALHLGMPPSELLREVDRYEDSLRQMGVDVVSEKKDYSAAVAIGLGLLAAALLK